MRVRELWAEDRCAFGGWCVVPSPFSGELMAAAGFDYVCVDCQHGLIGYDALVGMLQAISRTRATALVRVPSNDASWIGKALDAGADGVIVPMVNSRAEAEAAVAACRYPPEGVRSFGPVRAAMLSAPAPDAANRRVLCFVMIETRHAVAAAADICSTPRVDGVYIGPADLAVSLGLAPTTAPTDPAHLEAIERVRRACADAGIIAGIHSASGSVGASQARTGFRLVTIASDAGLVQAGAARAIAEARQTAAPARGTGPHGG